MTTYTVTQQLQQDGRLNWGGEDVVDVVRYTGDDQAEALVALLSAAVARSWNDFSELPPRYQLGWRVVGANVQLTRTNNEEKS